MFKNIILIIDRKRQHEVSLITKQNKSALRGTQLVPIGTSTYTLSIQFRAKSCKYIVQKIMKSITNFHHKLFHNILKHGFLTLVYFSDIDECSSIQNPCENGATCVDNDGSYTCSCLAGYEGPNCQDSKILISQNEFVSSTEQLIIIDSFSQISLF